ncbi:MAG: hypothetical protein EOP38_15705 [Rubrivivax sp.]|nr:MAG: hypothetical protein EOP38_15705 [Rubrivivax sp.]
MFKFLVAAAGLAACFSVQAELLSFPAVDADGTPIRFGIAITRADNDPSMPFLPEVSTQTDGTIVHRFDTDLFAGGIQILWVVYGKDSSFYGGADNSHVVVESMLRPDNTTALRIHNDYGKGARVSGYLDVDFVCNCTDLYVSRLSLNLLDRAFLNAGRAHAEWTYYPEGGPAVNAQYNVAFAAVPEPDALALVLAGLVVSGVLWKRTSPVAASSGSARSATA